MATLDDLNRADDQTAFGYVSPLIERAPDIARRVAARRPFANLEALSSAIQDELSNLNEAESIALFREHPELAPENPLSMTAESQNEQGRMDLTCLQSEYRETLASMNSEYQKKFGFPFITALVRHPNMESVLDEFRDRLNAERDAEIRSAIEQVAAVSAARVRKTFEECHTGSSFDSDRKNRSGLHGG
ncbi:2-oxo-4-hydroxy-4-carboxy-5-ureidoimidazoline decarboxylase [Ruegeria marina]|uniref:2-oxo-4-hydroxy-4-carboxy-5-ureidoimidazoline decarboxylase n=1 Tax=Ruegeria marina TaxID=639004 RepID=A0A1G6VFQ4_9RHOB|nr:2-oxo-4-hydroxy-4-carboxy-5-ureidoimidazoline decarboxylase [Ruegeria marina]SDD52173.1 2-oxo-4-hydroxy-4-carboxy-5-ureidoimidazoline decarboxylase [Ruegeria marina]